MSAERTEFDETVAIRDLIRSDPRLIDRVIVGSDSDEDNDIPVLDPPYVTISRSRTAIAEERLGLEVDRPSWNISGVGDTELAADAVLGWVDAKLRPDGRGVTLAVPGRRTWPIRRLERPGNATDYEATPPVAYAIAVYGFESIRDPSRN